MKQYPELLCCVFFLFICLSAVTPAMADEPTVIDSVSIPFTTDTIALMNGFDYSPEEAPYTAVLSIDGFVLMLQPGTTYTVGFIVSPKDGYTFSSDVTATVNDEAVTPVRDGENLTITYTFMTEGEAATPISAVNIEFSEAAGSIYNKNQPLVFPDDTPYSATMTVEKKSGSGTPPESVTLTAGDEYSVSLTITADEDHTFDSDMTVTINGKAVESVFVLGNTTLVNYDFTATDPSSSTVIDSVSIPLPTKIPLLIAGPFYAPEDESYTAALVLDGFILELMPGTEYTLELIVIPGEGYTFSSDVTATVNDEAVTPVRDGENLTITYTFTTEGEALTPISAVNVEFSEAAGSIYYNGLPLIFPDDTPYSATIRVKKGYEYPRSVTLEAGNKYGAVIRILPNENYCFASDVTVTVNGKTVEPSIVVGSQMEVNYGEFIAAAPSPTTAQLISSVAIPLTESVGSVFEEGDYVPLPEDAAYTAKVRQFLMVSPGQNKIEFLLEPKEGYAFSTDMTATVNGNKLTVNGLTDAWIYGTYSFIGIEKADVKLTYVSADETMGTVWPAFEFAKEETGCAGSLAIAADGFRFVNWTVTVNDEETEVCRTISLSPSDIDAYAKDGDVYVETTFTARFERSNDPLPADTYYTYKGDYTRAGVIDGAGPTGPDILWDVCMPYNNTLASFFDAHPVIVGDHVYTSAWGGMVTGGLNLGTFCFNKTTGEEIWCNPAVIARSGMTADGDHLYIGDGCALSCLDQTDGSLVWKTADISTQAYVGHTSAPVIRSGIVYVTGSLFDTKNRTETDSLLGFDAGSGREVFRMNINAENGLPGGAAMFASISMSPDGILFVPGKGGVVAVDAQTCGIVWEFDAGAYGSSTTGGNNAYVGSPVYKDGFIYVVTGGGYNLMISCLDAESGAVVWQKKTTGGAVTPCVTDDLVVTADGSYRLTDGEQVCTFTYLDNATTNRASPIVAGNTMYIGTYRTGVLHAFNINTGELEWSYEVHRIPGATESSFTPIECVPVIENGILYFGAENGHFYAIKGPDDADTFTITASPSENGIISPAGDTVVEAGGSVVCTITPDNGWHIADVLVDGVSVGAVSSYRFSNVDADHTIAAVYEKDGTQPKPTRDTVRELIAYLANGDPLREDYNYDLNNDFRINGKDLILAEMMSA